MRELNTHRYADEPVVVAVAGPEDSKYPEGEAHITVHDGDVRKPRVQAVIPAGIPCEALLAVVVDRLRRWAKTKYECPERIRAETHALEAIRAFHDRTARRIALGIKGTDRTQAEVEGELAARAADRVAQVDAAMKKCDEGQLLTPTDVELLEGAKVDGSLSLARRALVTQALVKADRSNLFPAKE